MQTSKRLNNIGEYYFSQKLREIDELNKQGKNIINLGIGSPDLPPHPDVVKALQQEAEKVNTHAYQSYKGSPIFRKAICDWYKKWYSVNLNPDTEVLPLIGSKEGIMHICMTYFEEGIAVLVPNPGYPTYSSTIRLSGAQPVYYDLKEENNYAPDFEQLNQLIKDQSKNHNRKTAAIFVNYPHMPTGQLPTKELFGQLIAFAKANGILIIHDNPYSFILNDSPMSMLSVDGAMDCVLELNSLSKSHNMAGWRVGMVCASKDKIDDILRFKSNMDSGMFLPVQLAAAAALALGKEWQQEVNNVYRERRELLFQLLSVLNCEYSTKQAGLFVWAKVPEQYIAAKQNQTSHPLGGGGQLSDDVLYNTNVFITPGGIFGSEGNNYVRVSLCATNEKIKQAILQIKSRQESLIEG